MSPPLVSKETEKRTKVKRTLGVQVSISLKKFKRIQEIAFNIRGITTRELAIIIFLNMKRMKAKLSQKC